MEINQISGIVVDEAYHLHSELGPGLLESVYEVVLCHRLQKRGLSVFRQVPIPVCFDGISFDEGFRADLLVEQQIVVELKSTEQNHPVHAKQLLTYLRLSGKSLGLLINFGLPLLKDGLKRIAHQLPPESSLPKSSANSAPPREPD
jgi:GxxExxY protein